MSAVDTAAARALPRIEAGGRRELLWRLAPVAVAALSSLAYLIAEPRTVDFAAGLYRTHLFGEEGLALWNGNWYSGHHVLGYSVLFPPLGWLVGNRVLGALCAILSAALFDALAREHFGERARWGTVFFGLAATASLWSGRIPFLLGVTIGLAAALALQRERRWLAVVLALACGLASPVAGAFLGLAAVAYGITHADRRGLALAVLAAAFVPALLIGLAFGTDGREPFDLSTFWPLPLMAIGFALVAPREERTLRVAALLYAAAAVAAYVIDSPMGGNAARFAGLLGAPVLLCVVLAHGWPRRRTLLTVAAVTLAGFTFIQWSPPVRDVIKAVEDPSVDAAYYEPLNEFLRSSGGPPGRVEIPFTRSHWEAYEVARDTPLARGWLRQADIERNGLFYGGALDSLTYAAWLSEHGVRWVALPDAKPDYSSYDERAMIEAGLPYLELRARLEHWRVYEVTLPTAMVVPQGGDRIEIEELGNDHVVLRALGPGEGTLRVGWSHFWKPSAGCVERDGEWTRVIAERAGTIRLNMDFAPGRLVDRGRRCA
jgi:MFS family permease